MTLSTPLSLDIVGGRPLPNCPFSSSHLSWGTRQAIETNITAGDPLLVVHSPTISLSFAAMTMICLTFAVVSTAYYSSVKILNRKISEPAVRNGWWEAYFATCALCFFLEFLRYISDTPNSLSTASENNATQGSIVQPNVIDAWLLLGAAICRSTILLFLTLALHHQYSWRSWKSGMLSLASSSSTPHPSSTYQVYTVASIADSPVRVVDSRSASPTAQFCSTDRHSAGHFPRIATIFETVSYMFSRRASQVQIAETDAENDNESSPLLGSERGRSAVAVEENIQIVTSRSVSPVSGRPGTLPPESVGQFSTFVENSANFEGPRRSSRLVKSVPSYSGVQGTTAMTPRARLERGNNEEDSEVDDLQISIDTSLYSRSRQGSQVSDNAQPAESRTLHDVPTAQPSNLKALAGTEFQFLLLLFFRSVILFLFINPPNFSQLVIIPPVLIDGITRHSTALFVLYNISSWIQFFPVFILTWAIFKDGPPKESEQISPDAPLITTGQASARALGPPVSSKCILISATLFQPFLLMEPSLLSRIIIALVQLATGTSSPEDYGYQSHMCVIAPWWWIERRPAHPAFSDSALFLRDQKMLSDNRDFSLIGWASWVDCFQWIGLVSIVFYFIFHRREYHRVKKEWIYKIVTSLQSVFDI